MTSDLLTLLSIAAGTYPLQCSNQEVAKCGLRVVEELVKQSQLYCGHWVVTPDNEADKEPAAIVESLLNYFHQKKA